MSCLINDDGIWVGLQTMQISRENDYRITKHDKTLDFGVPYVRTNKYDLGSYSTDQPSTFLRQSARVPIAEDVNNMQ